MKKIFIITVLILCTTIGNAQVLENTTLMKNSKSVLNLSFNDGQQQLRIGGFIGLNGQYINAKESKAEYRFGVKSALFNIEGNFKKEKLSFLLQMDFSDSYPLLDAWMAYQPLKELKITVGQKQTFTNSREMMFLNQSLAFGERSLMSQVFSRTGRELGLFLESRLSWGSVGFDLGAAVTTGDGRNSFGSSSIDFDLGGIKYGGRVSVYPLGFFTGGNELLCADFARESSPKLAIGGAYSYNVGASNSVGEGHNDFILYDIAAKPFYPNYQKMSFDVLLKYNGFTFLAEYVNTIAAKISTGVYTKPDINATLQPREIANYLAVGSGYNLQAGYLFKNNFSVDGYISMIIPEFEETAKSVLRKTTGGALGVSKYFGGNNIKVQALGSYKKYTMTKDENSREFNAELIVQLMF